MRNDRCKRADGSVSVEAANAITLAIPFDYSPITYSFAKRVLDGYSIEESYAYAIVHDAREPIQRFLNDGSGASCLGGSLASAEMFEALDIGAHVVRAEPSGSKGIHFATIADDGNGRYYTDMSIGLVQPMRLEDHVDDSGAFAVRRSDPNRYVVSVNGRDLWSFDPDEHVTIEDMIDAMIERTSPLVAPDPTQYLSIGAVRSVQGHASPVRIRCALDTKRESYEITMRAGSSMSRDVYAPLHDPTHLRTKHRLIDDLASLIGTSIPLDYFTVIDAVNKVIHETRTSRR